MTNTWESPHKPTKVAFGETETNDAGGKQSKIEVAFHLIPAEVLIELAEVLYAGMKRYGAGNWQKLAMDEDNVNHAIYHLYQHLKGDTSDNHLVHAMCRCAFARWQQLHPQEGKTARPPYDPEVQSFEDWYIGDANKPETFTWPPLIPPCPIPSPKRRLRVYVAGPYSSNPEANTSRALSYGDYLLRHGYAPYVPHLTHFWAKQHPHSYRTWLDLDLDYLRSSGFDALLRLDGKSKGSEEEITEAKKLGIPVFYELAHLVRHFGKQEKLKEDAWNPSPCP